VSTLHGQPSISADAAIHDVNFQNYGGLAIVYRDTVVFQKRKLDICVSTFQYLYGYATTTLGQFVLFGVHRPGSQALSSLFFDELSATVESFKRDLGHFALNDPYYSPYDVIGNPHYSAPLP